MNNYTMTTQGLSPLAEISSRILAGMMANSQLTIMDNKYYADNHYYKEVQAEQPADDMYIFLGKQRAKHAIRQAKALFAELEKENDK